MNSEGGSTWFFFAKIRPFLGKQVRDEIAGIYRKPAARSVTGLDREQPIEYTVFETNLI